MELIEAEDKEQGPLPEPEPRYKAELPEETDSDDDSGRPGWLAPLIIAIIVAAIVVGLVFLARWIYHEVNHNNAPAVSSNSSKKTAGAPSAQSGANGTSAHSSSNSSSNPSGSTSSNQKSSGGSNKQLANTGPGDVVGLFIGASLAAAGLHFIVNLRRQAEER